MGARYKIQTSKGVFSFDGYADASAFAKDFARQFGVVIRLTIHSDDGDLIYLDFTP